MQGRAHGHHGLSHRRRGSATLQAKMGKGRVTSKERWG